MGVGGSIATTAIAGLQRIEARLDDTSHMPLTGKPLLECADYADIVYFGWDTNPQDLLLAAKKHAVIDVALILPIAEQLAGIRPLPGIQDQSFSANVVGSNVMRANSHRSKIEQVIDDIKLFKRAENLDDVVVINVASTEKLPDLNAKAHRSLSNFEFALDADDPAIGPAMLYAYAAISAGSPFANFTPSLATDTAPLHAFADKERVPIAGKDGKTGQTLLKTVLAPLFRERGLKVQGWYSTNLLGNSDGLALDDTGSKSAKIETKMHALQSMLGYDVPAHRVDIHFHIPKGDNKEAWDSIDLVGFMGARMQMKVNFLCSDSSLAAPLVIEICRLLQVAKRRGEFGPQAQLSCFFKSPQVRPGEKVVHGFFDQQKMLIDWLRK